VKSYVNRIPETVHRQETIRYLASRGDDDNVGWQVRSEGVTAVFWWSEVRR
jgi:hypothetical protein